MVEIDNYHLLREPTEKARLSDREARKTTGVSGKSLKQSLFVKTLAILLLLELLRR